MVDEHLRLLGEGIRERRSALGLTQADLAELAEMSERTLRDIERGAASPSIGSVERACAALGLRLTAAGDFSLPAVQASQRGDGS